MVGNVDPSGFFATMRDDVAYPLLQQFGFTGAILVQTNATFNPVTGMLTSPGSQFSFACQALYGSGGRTSSGVTKTTEGKTLTRVTTKEVNVDATLLTIQPSTDDKFEDESGLTYEILSVSPVNPGGLTVMWKLMVKY